MATIKFLATAWETGNSTVLTVPYEYVDVGAVKKGTVYRVSVEEV